jgi:hypothetical protein
MSNTQVVVAPLETLVVEPTVVAPTKASKKPSLPAKYSKFLSFAFWFASRLEPDARDAFYQQFKLFSSLEEQTEFFQTYLDEASASNKIMRKTIANHNKPVKTRAPKASRKPSKPVAAETDDLIATLIADANGEPLAAPVEKQKKTRKPSKPVAAETDDKPKKEKKSKKVVEPVVTDPVVTDPVVTDPVAEPVAEPVTAPVAEPVAKKTKTSKPKAEKPKAEKPKADKPKKEKKDKTTVQEQPPVDDSDDSVQAHIVQLNGSQYLMDYESNIYDINSHEQIGTYNPDTNSVVMN